MSDAVRYVCRTHKMQVDKNHECPSCRSDDECREVCMSFKDPECDCGKCGWCQAKRGVQPEPTALAPDRKWRLRELAAMRGMFARLRPEYSCDYGEPNPSKPFLVRAVMCRGDYEWLRDSMLALETELLGKPSVTIPTGPRGEGG